MNRLIYVILAAVSIFLGVIYLNSLHQEVEKNTIDQLLKQQEIYAVQAAKGIETFFENCKNSLHYFAQSPDIVNKTKKSSSELKKFYNSFEGQVSAVSRISKDGVLVDTYPFSNAVGRDLSHQKHNQILMNEHIPVISDVITVVQGYKAVVFGYPVFKNGKYNGAVAVLIPYKYVANKYLDKIKIGQLGYAYMLSENGVELYYPFGTVDKSSERQEYNSKERYLNLSEKMLKANPGTTKFKDVNLSDTIDNLSDKIAYYYPIKLENTFWSVAVVVSSNEVLQINEGFNSTFLIVVSLICLVIILLMLLYFYSIRRAEKKLKLEEEKYKITVEQTGQIIYNTNYQTETISFAGAVTEVLGYDPDEFNMLSIEEFINLIHPEDRDKCLKVSLCAREDSGVFNSVFRIKNKSNEYIYIEDHGTCLQNSQGKCESMIGTIKDISDRIKYENLTKQKNIELEKLVKERTEKLNIANQLLQEDIKKRERTEEELKIAKELAEKSDNLKSEFLAQMSHEIRTPVNSLLSFSTLIKEETKEIINPEIAESFSVIDNAGRRIIRTIDLLLNMSQLQTDSYVAKFGEFNFAERVIYNIYSEYKKIAADKGLSLSLNCPNLDEKIYADEYTVFQIFNNLVDNAVKYTKEGNVNINVQRNEENKLIVDIEDTGIGIAEEYIPNLFNAFSQEEQGYTRKYEGNGLGLALVKKYCEINDADISVTSEKGKGTKFSVVFTS